MKKDVFTNVVANILAGALLAVIALGLHLFGIGNSDFILVFLAALLILFVVMSSLYLLYKRWLTIRLVKDALYKKSGDVNGKDIALKKSIINMALQEADFGQLMKDILETKSGSADEKSIALKKTIVDTVLRQAEGNGSFTEFPSQNACQELIKDAFRNAKTIKILTIRGFKYFLSDTSLFHKIYEQRYPNSLTIQMLVLSPDYNQDIDKVAERLGHTSAEDMQEKASLVLKLHKVQARQHKNFQVRYCQEKPPFKVLLFDDVMFVSAYIDARKNDDSAKMFQVKRGNTSLFVGFEKFFDDLWERSVES